MWIPTLILAFLTLFTASVQAQTFFWGFPADFVSTTLETCQTLPIRLIANNGSLGVGPYTLVSMEIGGIPISTPLGNGTNMTWTVPHKPGTTLMLTVFDSQSKSGGIPNNLFNVVAGSDNSCLPNNSQNTFSVSANTTTTISTCESWGITVQGGTKPYTAIMAALNNFPTLITFQPTDDGLVFVDRVSPNLHLIAAIKDANGNFATGTPQVQTSGSTNTACPGLLTHTGSAAAFAADNAVSLAAAASAAQARQRTVTGAVVAVVIIILILIGVCVWLYLRKRRADQGHIEGQDARSRPFEVGSVDKGISGGNDISAPVFVAFRRGSETSEDSMGEHECHEKCPCGRYGRQQQDVGVGPYSPVASSFAMRHASSASSIGRSSVGSRNRILPASPRPPGRVGRSSSVKANTASRLALVDGNDADIIIQHRDGGQVQELPPPYMLPPQAGPSSSSHPLPIPPPLRDIKQPISDEEDSEAGPSGSE